MLLILRISLQNLILIFIKYRTFLFKIMIHFIKFILITGFQKLIPSFMVTVLFIKGFRMYQQNLFLFNNPLL